jgi:hypothetical protein
VILPNKLEIDSALWDRLVWRASKHETWDMPPVRVRAFEQGFKPTSRLQAAKVLAIANFADDLYSWVQIQVVA